jgi:type II secretion system protein N
MDRLKRILPFLGYGFFYLVVFFFACYLTFPYQRLRDRILAEMAAEQKGKPSNMRLEIEELEPYWFSGVRARGVKVTMLGSGKEDDPPTAIELEEVRARVSILYRIFGTTRVSFFARAFGGEASGVFKDGSTERKVELEMTDLAVGRIDPLVHLVGLPLYGLMSGKADLTFPDKRASKADGTLTISVKDLAAGDGKAKIKGALAIPKMNAGELVLDTEVKEGLVKINTLSAKGPDLDLVAEGKVTLRDHPTESITDVYVRFKFSDAYRNRNDVTKGLFGAPGSTAPALFELADPKIRQSKRTDGFYGWHMMGLLNAARFEPFAGNPVVPANQLKPQGRGVKLRRWAHVPSGGPSPPRASSSPPPARRTGRRICRRRSRRFPRRGAPCRCRISPAWCPTTARTRSPC